MLELAKGQAIVLNKEAGKTLSRVTLGAGWDVAEGKSIDLDLWLLPRGGAPCFYNNMTIPGAVLSGDDRTGAGSADGADETINIDVAALAHDEYTVLVNIYNAAEKGQFFRDVKRAFVEVVDAETGTKIFNFNMSHDGGDNSSLVAGTLTRTAEGLTFTAIAELSSKTADVIAREVGSLV